METEHARRDEQRGAALAKFILNRKSEILALWEGSVRRLPDAPGAAEAGAVRFRPAAARGDRPGHQSELRWPVTSCPRIWSKSTRFNASTAGSTSAESSWSIRFCATRSWSCGSATAPPGSTPARSGVLHRAIDRAISLSVERFAEAQGRAERALNRIANASLESHDLDDLLRRLLVVVIETVPAVDTAAILLREDGVC